MNSNIELSVVIPAYNEQARLGSYLTEVVGYLEISNYLYEVFVVDDGSTDRTSSIVNNFTAKNQNVKLIRIQSNKGKGNAVRVGMLATSGKFCLFTDADGATPIKELDRLFNALENGADVAIASRAFKNSSCNINAHLHRKIIGRIFHFFVRLIAVQGFADTQCGFKLFSRKAVDDVFPYQRIFDFGFDVELLYICLLRGFRVIEIPVNWTDVNGSKVKLIRDSVRMFIDIILIRINVWRGYY
jgi:dolichyl-phosphate beta-glucosyltransferase